MQLITSSFWAPEGATLDGDMIRQNITPNRIPQELPQFLDADVGYWLILFQKNRFWGLIRLLLEKGVT